MEIYRAVVVVLLAAWLVASILAVLRWRGLSTWRWLDTFGMLSTWRLFAPSGQGHWSAYPLLYRDRMRDGSTGPLKIAASGAVTWTPRVVFWSGEWAFELLVRRLVKQLQKDARLPGANASERHAYRHLVHIVSRCPRSPETEARQFVVLATASTSRGAPPVRIFQSGFHRL